MEKLYVVIDVTLDKTDWIPQVSHGIAQYFIDHPEAARRWHENGNTIVCLSAEGPESLEDVFMRAEGCVSSFFEPDLANRRTVVVLEGMNGRRLRRHKLITP